jgi:hypothetical protein
VRIHAERATATTPPESPFQLSNNKSRNQSAEPNQEQANINLQRGYNGSIFLAALVVVPVFHGTRWISDIIDPGVPISG